MLIVDGLLFVGLREGLYTICAARCSYQVFKSLQEVSAHVGTVCIKMPE